MLEPRALLLRECFTIFTSRPFTVGGLLERAGLNPALATVIRAAIPALALDPSPGVVRGWLYANCDEPIVVNITLPPARHGRPLTGVERVQRHRKRRLHPPLPFDSYYFERSGRDPNGEALWRVTPADRAANDKEQMLETA